MTVERAILLTVGGLIILSVLLAVYVNINWLWLTGILGAHLVQASFTGLCPVVMMFKRMGLCRASPASPEPPLAPGGFRPLSYDSVWTEAQELSWTSGFLRR